MTAVSRLVALADQLYTFEPEKQSEKTICKQPAKTNRVKGKCKVQFSDTEPKRYI